MITVTASDICATGLDVSSEAKGAYGRFMLRCNISIHRVHLRGRARQGMPRFSITVIDIQAGQTCSGAVIPPCAGVSLTRYGFLTG
jgi:hypothetical protein